MGAAAETIRESRRALADVFRSPGLRRVQLAFAGSVVGDWAYAVAVAVYAYAEGGPTAVGLLAVARYGVAAVATPFTATLADRLPRKRVMIGSDILRGAIVAAAAGVVLADGPALAVYVLAVSATVAGTPFRPAQAAILPSLARDPGELTAANVTASTVESVGFFLGPALGGLLLGVASVEVVFLFNVATFLVSALIVTGIHEQRAASPAPTADGGGFLAEAAEGFRLIGRDRDLRLLVVVFALQCVVAGASAVYVVAIGLDLLDVGPSGVGLLEGVTGVGGLIGGLVALPLARRNRLSLDFGAGVVLWSAPLLLIAAWPSVAPAAVAFALVGLGNAIVDINAFTILQRLVPDHVLGRVFGAVESLLVASMALGSLLAPALIHAVGIRAMLVAVGATVSLAVLAGVPGLVRVDGRILPPPHLELLRRVPLLAPLQEATLERLAYAVTELQLPAGADVFRAGDAGDRFYVVVAGEVTILGRAFGPGECFGEIALLRDVPRTATVSARSDVTLLALERDDFIPAVTGHGDALAAADALVGARLLR